MKTQPLMSLKKNHLLVQEMFENRNVNIARKLCFDLIKEKFIEIDAPYCCNKKTICIDRNRFLRRIILNTKMENLTFECPRCLVKIHVPMHIFNYSLDIIDKIREEVESKEKLLK